ncbi:hypothetical protein LAT59_00525 [Candidatus Gracilibacteria bacterium]|nr:hypothetical protein [Candidatus Gracilibacteria bacterium]
MARRKKSPLTKLSQEHINMLVALTGIFLALITLIGDTQSLIGFYTFDILSKTFGEYYKLVFSPVLILLGIKLFTEKTLHFNSYRAFGLLFYFLSLTTILGVFFHPYEAYFNLYDTLIPLLGKATLLACSIGLWFASLYILFRFSVVHATMRSTQVLPRFSDIKESFKVEKELAKVRKEQRSVQKTGKTQTRVEKKLEKEASDLEKKLEELRREKEQLAKMKQPKQLELQKQTQRKVSVSEGSSSSSSGIASLFTKKSPETDGKTQVPITNFNNWQLPTTMLLQKRDTEIRVDDNEVRTKEIEIQEKLLQFGISVTMEGYKVGPTVIQYRLKPSKGVKLQSIVNLKKDLTLALHAKSIRIQAPIPGLGVVGVEVPNEERQAVGLRELLESPQFKNKKLEIPIAIGKDVSGDLVFGDLTKMPHLLVAGQTASGKSVGMNGFLLSMLYKFSPSELKMIMVDPKRVELSVYNGIPHLLTPVITNPEKALNALKWAVAEMLRRYDMATKVNARNLLEYNAKVNKSEKLPYIVIVIDELADLMMSGQKKEVEGSIARIAQMARAVGMHLIVATQRPSVDVITGLIKANIPSRIAFTVASQIDSRTVIDKMGAEDLLGRGDMLYYPTGNLAPERVQGVLVETGEVEAVVNPLKLTIDPDMLNNLQDTSIADGRSNKEGSILEGYEGDQDEDPAIIEKAIQVVKETRKGSTSLIQRKLGLGYARAAKVLDILEELGVVGPANGSKPREVYVD